MVNLTRPDPAKARKRILCIGPLVRAIAREIRESSNALLLLEAAASGNQGSARELRHGSLRAADAAVERRALERATHELERLGCTIVAWTPLTIAVERQRKKSLWMLDDPT